MYRRFLIAAVAVLVSATSAAARFEAYIGEITTFGTTFCPQGYLPTDGRLLPVAGNDTLFAVLGFTYGGDGQTTFGIPKMTVATGLPLVTPLSTCICVDGIFPSMN